MLHSTEVEARASLPEGVGQEHSITEGGDFEMVLLGEVASVRSGFAFKSRDWVDAGVPVVKIGNVKEGNLTMEGCSFVSSATADSASEANLRDGDILIAMTGYIGDTALVRSRYLPAALNQRVGRFSIHDRARLDNMFLFYSLRREEVRDQIRGLGYGSAQPNVSPSLIHSVSIPLPPLGEQRAIARVLGAFDDKIELNRRMSETLEEMARALFRSWFVDFDPVRAKAEGRPSGLPPDLDALFPASFEASELGEIPAGWEVRAISSLTSINDWTLRASDHLKLIDYVEISAVTTGDIERVQRYARGEEPSRARRRLRHGDTVLSTVRPDRGSYFLCLDPPDSLVASTGFAVLTPTEAPWALVHTTMTQPELFERLGHLADGAAYPAVRANVIGETMVSWCGADVAARFHEAVAPIYELAARGRRESHTLAELRDMLLPRLVSGELRVGTSETWT